MKHDPHAIVCEVGDTPRTTPVRVIAGRGQSSRRSQEITVAVGGNESRAHTLHVQAASSELFEQTLQIGRGGHNLAIMHGNELIGILPNVLLMVLCPEGGLRFCLLSASTWSGILIFVVYPPALLPAERGFPNCREIGLLDRGRLFCNARHSRQ